MEQELINELNRKIIEQYESFLNDLSGKFKIFVEIRNERKLDDETLNNLLDVINDMKKTINSLKKQITNMKRKADQGISLFQNSDKRYRSILTDNKYSDSYDKTSDKLEKTERNISKLEDNISHLDDFGNEKVVGKVKVSLEKRLENLKKKKGSIQNRQSKIADKAIKEKLGQYVVESKTFNKIGNKIIINNDKTTEINDRQSELELSKDNISRLKTELLTDKDLRNKALGVKVMFNEKLTQSRILALQAKKGTLDFEKKYLIKRGVNPSVIRKMKDKVSLFGKAVSESFKTGVDTFKGFYEDVSFEEPLRSSSR